MHHPSQSTMTKIDDNTNTDIIVEEVSSEKFDIYDTLLIVSGRLKISQTAGSRPSRFSTNV